VPRYGQARRTASERPPRTGSQCELRRNFLCVREVTAPHLPACPPEA